MVRGSPRDHHDTFRDTRRKAYGDKLVLDGGALSIGEGEVFARQPNGARIEDAVAWARELLARHDKGPPP